MTETTSEISPEHVRVRAASNQKLRCVLRKRSRSIRCCSCCSLQFYRERVFGSFSHRDLRFGENQVCRFTLSTCSFEVEKEKRGLFLNSEGGRGVIGGETFASCKRGVFANEERPAPVRNRFSMTLSRSEGGSSEKETKVRSNWASSSSWRRS